MCEYFAAKYVYVSLAFRRDEESLTTNWYWLEIPRECWRGAENGGKTSTPIKEDEVKSSGDHQFLHSHKSPRRHCDVEVFWCIVQTAVCICADNTSKDSQDLIFHLIWIPFLGFHGIEDGEFTANHKDYSLKKIVIRN